MSLETLQQMYSAEQLDAGLFSLGYSSAAALASTEPRRSRQVQELGLRVKLMKPSETQRWLALKKATTPALALADLSASQAAIEAAIRARLDATVERLVQDKERSDRSLQLKQAQSERYAQYQTEQRKLRAELASAMRQRELKILAQRDATQQRLGAERTARWRETEQKIEHAHEKRSELLQAAVNEDVLSKRQQELDKKYEEAQTLRRNRAQEIADRAGMKRKLLEEKEAAIKKFWSQRASDREQTTQKKLQTVQKVLETQRVVKEDKYINNFNKLLTIRDKHEQILSARSESVKSAREGALAKNRSSNDSLMRSRSESARSYRQNYDRASAYAEEVKRRGLKNGIDMQTHANTRNKMCALADENAGRIGREDDRKEKFLLRKMEEIRLQTEAKLRDRRSLQNHKKDFLRKTNVQETQVRQVFERIKAETDKKRIVKALTGVGIDHAKLGLFAEGADKNKPDTLQ